MNIFALTGVAFNLGPSGVPIAGLENAVEILEATRPGYCVVSVVNHTARTVRLSTCREEEDGTLTAMRTVNGSSWREALHALCAAEGIEPNWHPQGSSEFA